MAHHAALPPAPYLGSRPSLVHSQRNSLVPIPESRVDVVAEVTLELFRLFLRKFALPLRFLQERMRLDVVGNLKIADKTGGGAGGWRKYGGGVVVMRRSSQ